MRTSPEPHVDISGGDTGVPAGDTGIPGGDTGGDTPNGPGGRSPGPERRCGSDVAAGHADRPPTSRSDPTGQTVRVQELMVPVSEE
ncbi:hypothetical protein GCM10009828_021720 [Actinoplanes couchii]|uniref:Uncharacterized protein n=1 Tax=Actinoplanes couchii TaxID=403638 RepID=A0ABQ3XI13_9ACTN|nr:hypothetical protein Aco03nite_065220 [Actinoplanes couchii]